MFRCKTKMWITCVCLPLLFIPLLSSCTNESTSSVSPTATTNPFDRLVFRDGFDSEDGSWHTYSTGNGSVLYENGKLHIKDYTDSEYVSPSGIQMQYSDFALEVEMALVSGSSASCQIVICRYSQTGSYYLFYIDGNGEYSIQKYIEGVWTTLKAATPSSYIKTGLGVTNEVRVDCVGDSLTLYVNGVSVAQASDGELAIGKVFLAVQSIGDEYTEAAFDNVVIWTS